MLREAFGTILVNHKDLDYTRRLKQLNIRVYLNVTIVLDNANSRRPPPPPPTLNVEHAEVVNDVIATCNFQHAVQGTTTEQQLFTQ